MSNLKNGRKDHATLEIQVGDETIRDEKRIAEEFGRFFSSKVEQLSAKATPEKTTKPVFNRTSLEFSEDEVLKAVSLLKNKKSCGIDEIPMCVVKSTARFLIEPMVRLFNRVANEGMPQVWKLAKVVPLHKKGNRNEMSNYRPISNLCSISKLYERLLLNRINMLGDNDGPHQHGFRSQHSTTTAILNVQRSISETLDEGNDAMIYSIDLSAAFDMLRKDTLINNVKRTLGDNISSAVYDFLSDRKCLISVGDANSEILDVSIGCVQGSVLGPKLFSLYTNQVEHHLTANAEITTYADDSYVVIKNANKCLNSLRKETEECLEKHSKFLRDLGMIVNQEKTEIMHISRQKQNSITNISLGETTIKTQHEMKILGVTLDDRLTWTQHISKTIGKLCSLTSGLKFLRRKFNIDQFLRILTSQYYGLGYYACQAWLGPHTRKADVKKLESVHYRLLRIATRDYKMRTKRQTLDEIGRATPTQWMHYATANLVIKIIRDENPIRLCQHLKKTLFYTRREEAVMKFYDASSNKKGFQAIGNRLTETFNQIEEPTYLNESNDQLRLRLKKCFGMKCRSDPNVSIAVGKIPVTIQAQDEKRDEKACEMKKPLEIRQPDDAAETPVMTTV